MLLTIIAAMIGSSSADLPNCNTVGSCANVSDVIFGLNTICIEMLEDNSDCWKCIFSHLPPRMPVTSLEVSLCGLLPYFGISVITTAFTYSDSTLSLLQFCRWQIAALNLPLASMPYREIP
jgi:hypothetical protein